MKIDFEKEVNEALKQLGLEETLDKEKLKEILKNNNISITIISNNGKFEYVVVDENNIVSQDLNEYPSYEVSEENAIVEALSYLYLKKKSENK